MPIENTPVEEVSTSLDTPVEIAEQPQEYSVDLRRRYVLESALINTYLTGNNPYDAYFEEQSQPDPRGRLSQLSAQKSEEDVQALRSELEVDPGDTREQIESKALAVSTLQDKAYQDAGNVHKQSIDAFAEGQAPDGVRALYEGRLRMAESLDPLAQKVGSALGVTEEVLKGFIPFKDLIDRVQLTGSAFFGVDDDIQRAIENFQDWPLDVQEKMFPVIQAELSDFVSDAQVLTIMSAMISPSPGQLLGDYSELTNLLDAPDVLGVYGGLVTLLRRGVKQLNPVKMAGDLGRKDVAADINTEALVNPQVREQAGVDETLAAHNAMPFVESYDDVQVPDGYVLNNPDGSNFVWDAASDVWRIEESNVRVDGGELPLILDDEAKRRIFDNGAAEGYPTSGDLLRDAVDRQTRPEFNIPAERARVLEEQARGISSEVQERILAFQQQTQRGVEGVISGNVAQREHFLTTQDRLAREEKTRLELKQAQVENLRIDREASSPDQTVFRYDTRDNEGNLVPSETTLQFNINDAGYYDNVPPAGFANFSLASPTYYTRFSSSLQDAINAAQRTDVSSTRVANTFQNMFDQALKPLRNFDVDRGNFNGGGKNFSDRVRRVENVLLRGDELGEEFTYRQLSGEFQLADNEIEAYFNTRSVIDALWETRNTLKREEYRLRGFKGITVGKQPRDIPEESIGIPFEDLRSARASINDFGAGQNFKIWDATENRLVDIAELEAQYNTFDKRLVRLNDPYDTASDAGSFSYVLVNRLDVTELPDRVIAYRQGYIPKINQGANYFVKELEDRLVNGRTVRTPVVTLRYFDNEVEARRFIEQEHIKADEANVERRSLVLREDREEEEWAANNLGRLVSSSAGGGLYTGARSQDGLAFGIDARQATRLAPYEALARNIQNVANLVPRNAQRIGLEQRWLNSINQELSERGIETIQRFPQSDLAGNSDIVRKYNRLAAQIRDWNNIPTSSERNWDRLVQNTYEWALGKKYVGNFAPDLIRKLEGRDPASVARTVAFHSLLGVFNPRQLFVQGQSATTALSANGLHRIGDTLRQWSGVRWLVDDADYANLDKASRLSGIPQDELRNLMDAYRRTGLQESVLDTGDFNAASRGMGIDSGVFQRLLDKGLFFYRAGEHFNRQVSYISAYNFLKRQNGGVLDLTDDLVQQQLLTKTQDYMLNMSKSNRAQWQQGYLGVPTQFMQVQAKALETMVFNNRRLTPKERANLWMGQLAFYGAAGVPTAGIGTIMLEEYFGKQEVQRFAAENPTLIDAYNGGFFDTIFAGAFDISSNTSLLGGVEEFARSMVTDEKSPTEFLLGAFGTSGQRFFTKFARNIEPVIYDPEKSYVVDGTIALTKSFGELTSTLSNVQKAYLYATARQWEDKNGRVVFRDLEGPSFSEVIAQALGFTPLRLREIYEKSRLNRLYDEGRQGVVSIAVRNSREYMRKSNLGQLTDQEYDEHIRTTNLIMGMLPVGDQISISRAYNKEIQSTSTRENTVEKEFFTNTMTSGALDVKDRILNTSRISTLNLSDAERAEFIGDEE